MTEELFREDAYLRDCTARVVAASPEGVVLDRTVFYPAGGGQPGDTGELRLADGAGIRIKDTRKGEAGILHLPEEGAALPAPGAEVTATLDWERRHRHMRMHTCLHLLCAVVDAPVTGGQLGEDRGRLDFDLPEMPFEKSEIEARVNELVAQEIATDIRWITDAELEATPDLVRTMKVKPPTGEGRVRLMAVGEVDLQPCGGTHVQNTGEIGPITVRKIENKGKHNRRVSIAFKEA